jgi:hypothetical protein
MYGGFASRMASCGTQVCFIAKPWQPHATLAHVAGMHTVCIRCIVNRYHLLQIVTTELCCFIFLRRTAGAPPTARRMYLNKLCYATLLLHSLCHHKMFSDIL